MRTRPEPDTLLGGLSIEAFLEDYWQKKPLLIRGALPGYASSISPADLMAIACDPEADARLILEKDGDYPWQLLYGPFEEDFSGLPDSHWTLLVQEVNHYVPAIARLLDHFRFLPSWRIDDIMVSYAATNGGVGAHVDNYDVFLLQAMGQRRWQIMNTPVEEEVLVPDLDVRILKDFSPDDEWVLAPGDMLYLPPRIAHNGVALDPCMTFSIGCRAPGYAEMLAGFLGFAAERIDPLLRYSDPDLKPAEHPSRIGDEALARVRAILRQALADDRMIDEWFGRFVTEPRRDHYAYPLEEPVDPRAVAEHLARGGRLERFAGATFAHIVEASGDAWLFAGGLSFPFPAPLAGAVPVLCEAAELSRRTLAPYLQHPAFFEHLAELINEGYLEQAPALEPQAGEPSAPSA